MACLILLPFFLIRFGLLFVLSKDAVKRAAQFAPLVENEKVAYWLYQGSNAAIFLALCFLNIKRAPVWVFAAGLAVTTAGLGLLLISVIYYAFPAENGMNRTGPYRISRNPMYVAYFVFFLGGVLLTQSLVLLACVLLFQTAAHWMIRSEERWCVQRFGEDYLRYMKQVRRYI